MPVRRSLREDFPFHLIIGGEDYTVLLSDNFTFSNVDPGGFEMASFSMTKDLPRVKRGMNVRLSSGLQVAWEGRVREIQRSLGAKTLIQCEGYGAILKEQLKAEVFVDRDLTKWQGMTVAEQINITASGWSPGTPQISADPTGGAPAVVTEASGPWVELASPWIQAFYDARGLAIGALYYEWVKGVNVNAADTHWVWSVNLEDGGGGGSDNSANLRAAGPGAGYFGATTSTRKYAVVGFSWAERSAAGSANTPYVIFWHKLAVYGKGFNDYIKSAEFLATGEPQGVEPNPVGYYPSTIARFCAHECPGIQPGVIDHAAQYIVPHAAYLTPVPYEQIISDMAKVAGWHWGVWESPTYLTGNPEPRLDFRPPLNAGQATVWVRRNECQALDLRENLENLYDSAKVGYTEPAGVERSVEVTLDNPALDAVGLHRQVALSLGVGTQAAAESWGLIQLALLTDRARMVGSATLTEPMHGYPNYLSGVGGNGFAPGLVGSSDRAPWMLRAGLDRLRVVDLPTTDAWGAHNDLPIARVECSGSSSGITTNVEFGLGVNLMETLAAQLQGNLTAAGV